MLPPLPPPVLLAEAHPLFLLELLSFRSQQFLSNDPVFSLPVSSLCSPLHLNIFFPLIIFLLAICFFCSSEYFPLYYTSLLNLQPNRQHVEPCYWAFFSFLAHEGSRFSRLGQIFDLLPQLYPQHPLPVFSHIFSKYLTPKVTS